MTVDLSALPPPEIIEPLSFEAILAEHKADLLARHPAAAEVIDLESEPMVKLLEVGAYRELKLRARYNDEARALLLAFASDGDLDHIGVTYYRGERRLVITPADDTTLPPTPAVMETDEDYRYRLALKPYSYSVAGPSKAYEFHALSASGQVKSVSVTSPLKGTTAVHVLSRIGDGVPDAALLAAVSARLSDEEVRPLSEEVNVYAGSNSAYALDVGLVLFRGASGELALAAVQKALAAFAAEKHRLKTDVVRSAIDAAAHVAGVKKVIIDQPAADVVCGPSQAPYCTGIALRVVAVED